MHKNLVSLLFVMVVLSVAGSVSALGTVVCESEDGKRHVCVANTQGGVAVVRQLSRSACIQGRTWGYDGDSIWVNEGCRAEFTIGSPRVEALPVVRLDELVVCESVDGKPKRCGVDTSGGVQLVRRLSDSPCGFGRQWAYDADGIWVSGGCRAEFVARGPLQARAVIQTTTPAHSHEVAHTHEVTHTHEAAATAATTHTHDGSTHSHTGVTHSHDGTTHTHAAQHAPVASVAAVVPAGRTPGTLLCESENNGRKHCRTETRYGLTLVRQLSENICARDVSWGVDKDGVWVTNGCRGEFSLGHEAPAMTMVSSMPAPPTLVCESIDGRRNHCPVDTSMGVRLYRQISDSDCLLNSTWGVDANGVWVSGGCRAEFALAEGRAVLPLNAPAAGRVLCESKDGKRQVCAADTRLGVAVVRQTSDAPCILNSTWGFDSEGIWVTAGCRAEFILRR